MTTRMTALETSTRHMTDAATVDGEALDAREDERRARDLELSEMLGLLLLLEMGE